MGVVVPFFLPAVGSLRALSGVVPLECRSTLVAPGLIAVPIFVHLTSRKNTVSMFVKYLPST